VVARRAIGIDEPLASHGLQGSYDSRERVN
jgi:hypothetical protein